MNLDLALSRDERLEKVAFHVCWVSFLLALILMFVGGSQVVGSFDPYDDNANPVSITLGVVWVLASIAWPLALASVYSRFRPRIRNLRQHISDAKIDKLQHEVDKLKEQLGE